MTKSEILDLVGETAKQAQIRDDVCSRSLLIGLKAYFDFISDDIIRASMSLCGGGGGASGSCGTYTCALLAVGLKYNASLEQELENEALQAVGAAKFQELRERYLKEFGTTLCPEIQKQIYGRSYIFTNEEDRELYGQIADHNEKCAIVVEKAARLVAEMLLEDAE